MSKPGRVDKTDRERSERRENAASYKHVMGQPTGLNRAQRRALAYHRRGDQARRDRDRAESRLMFQRKAQSKGDTT